MAIELEHRFGRDSRVRDYWLAASEGFAVESADGRSVGTVRQVVRERDGRAAALVVEARHGLVGTDEMILEAEAVEEVAPWRSTLVVPAEEAPEPARTARTPRVAPAASRCWHWFRNGVAERASAVAGLIVTATSRAATAVHARWPGIRADLLHAWAWTVSALLGVAAVVAVSVARLVRALAARLTAARSAGG